MDESVEVKINMVLDWAYGTNKNFDPEFIESLQPQFEERGYLTEKQIEALDGIIEKWRIE